MTLMRGLADDLPLMQWLTQHIFPVEQKLTPERVHLGALLGCAEMLRTAPRAFATCTSWRRPWPARRIRPGCAPGWARRSSPSLPAYRDLDQAVDVIRALHDAYADHPRIGCIVMPHSVYTTTPELLQRARALAEELDLPLNVHLAESASETAQCLEQHGRRPVAHLHALGLLGPRTLAAHCVDLTADEIALLAATGTRVAHNPESNMKLASGSCPAQRLLDAGITVGLGTDGPCSNNNLDMFGEMASAALLQKLLRLDPTALPARTVLDMATRLGAACLDWPDVGAIAPGMRADLTALDLTQPGLQPMYNPVSPRGGTRPTARSVHDHGGRPRVLYTRWRLARVWTTRPLLAEVRAAARWVRRQFAGAGA
jgi:5-methylthioadenosine/S-adenosylhomocysteine deaminase